MRSVISMLDDLFHTQKNLNAWMEYLYSGFILSFLAIFFVLEMFLISVQISSCALLLIFLVILMFGGLNGSCFNKLVRSTSLFMYKCKAFKPRFQVLQVSQLMA